MHKAHVDFVQFLPRELSLHIVSFLATNAHDLVRCSVVNRVLYELCSDEYIWKVAYKWRWKILVDDSPAEREEQYSGFAHHFAHTAFEDYCQLTIVLDLQYAILFNPGKSCTR
jgi:hypothetical protein